MTTANARTDELGNSVSGVFDGGFRAEKIYGKSFYIWEVKMPAHKDIAIGQMIGSKDYDFIARFLLDREGFLAGDICRCSKKDTTRSVIFQGTEFRCNTYQVFKRKS